MSIPAVGRLAIALTLCLMPFASIPSPAEAADTETQQEIVWSAVKSINNFGDDPDMQWFRDNVGEAKAILIVPSSVRGGFILGGSGGSGVLLARDAQTGAWSYPAFYTLGSVTLGLQIGAEVSELVLLIQTDTGLDALLTTSVKLGGDVSVAAGPTGAGAKAQTADIIAFSRTKGLYGGINVEGAVVDVRDQWNQNYYGRVVRPVEILVTREVNNPDAEVLRRAVTKVASGN